MSSAQLSTKQIQSLVKGLESQGCKVREVKKGYLVMFPNQESTTFHRTPSDVRAVRNLKAIIVRNDVSWPL